MRITVIGTGYLGAVHAACMAAVRARSTRRGRSIRPGWPRCRRVSRRSSSPDSRSYCDAPLTQVRCGSATSLAEAVAFGDVHFICVGHAAEARF